MDEEAYVLLLSTSKIILERRYILKSSKKIVICALLIVVSIISLTLINTRTNKTFKYKGSTIALTIDGNSATSFPASGKYNVTVNCNNAKGRWNPKTWKLEITKITGTVTCDVSFNSNVSNLTTAVNNKATRNENGKRYQGKNPDNYVWFNDELWRIIGNIPVCLTSGCATTENRVKIIRNDSIGGIKYGGISTWMGSNIQNLLNTCYLGKTSSCDSYCYSYSTSVKGTCDYSADGIDTADYYGKMVEDVYFNVGTGDLTFKTAANYYTQEIATHTTSATKIGLMYASDWGYAIEGFTGVLGHDDGNPQNSSDKNWLMSNGYEWTMSAYSSTYPLRVEYLGSLDYSSASLGSSIRPVLYLKSSVYVVSGTGSKVDPYRIGM